MFRPDREVLNRPAYPREGEVQCRQRQGQPEARAFVERIATEFRECEQKLTELVEHENQLVVAYTLLTLELMGSHKLRTLPSSLLERRSKLTLRIGSFSTSMDLGGLARQLQKRHSASASGNPA